MNLSAAVVSGIAALAFGLVMGWLYRTRGEPGRPIGFAKAGLYFGIAFFCFSFGGRAAKSLGEGGLLWQIAGNFAGIALFAAGVFIWPAAREVHRQVMLRPARDRASP